MKLFVQLLILFLALTGAASLLVSFADVDFGTVDYWQRHGIFFLFFITLFPRLTLLFSSIPFGGLIWWLGFFFAPRLLVASLATITYWQTNPVLVVLAWFIAISGESAEKWGFKQQVHVNFGGTRFKGSSKKPHRDISDENVVDAEFRRMDDE